MARDPDFQKIITRLSALSERERQVTTLVCDGLSNKTIARKLGVTEGTVKIHLYKVYKKLGISTRNVLAAALALSRGDRSSARLMNARSESAKRLSALTNRRRQVATLACQGLSNSQIGEKLGMTVGTVKTHLHGIYEKLNIHSRAELRNALIRRKSEG